MPKKSVIPTILLAALLLPLIIPASTAFAQFTPSAGGQLNLNLQNNLFPTTPLNTTTANSTPAVTTPSATSSNGSINLFSGFDCASSNTGSTLNYTTDVAIVGLPIFLLDLITSFLADPPSGGFSIAGFGFNVDLGGGLEPLDEIIDYVMMLYIHVVTWGIVASLAVFLGGYLIDAGLVLNSALGQGDILDPIIGIVRGLVNIGFVLGFVVMAFATMLRREKWTASKVLPKFIIALLLVNFSSFIAIEIAKVGNGLTGGIIAAAADKTDPSKGIGGSLASTLNIAKIYTKIDCALKGDPNATADNQTIDNSTINNITKNKKVEIPEGEKGKLWEWVFSPVKWMLSKIAALIFADILAVISAVTLLIIFLFLILRYVALSILIILAPVAWLGFAFPDLKIPGIGNLWGSWWDNFLKWALYGPVLAFFLLATKLMVNGIGSTPALSSGTLGFAAGILQMIVIIIFSGTGIYIASKMGMMGSDYIMKGAGVGLGMTSKAISAPFRYQQRKFEQKAEDAQKRAEKSGTARDIEDARNARRKASLLANWSKGTQFTASTPAGAVLSKAGLNLPTSPSTEPVVTSSDRAKQFAKGMTTEELNKAYSQEVARKGGLRKERADIITAELASRGKGKAGLLTQETLSALNENDNQKLFLEIRKILSKTNIKDIKVKDIMSGSAAAGLPQEFSDKLKSFFVTEVLNSNPDTLRGSVKQLYGEDKEKFSAEIKKVLDSNPTMANMPDSVKKYLKSSAGRKVLQPYEEDVIDAAREAGREEGFEEAGKNKTR